MKNDQSIQDAGPWKYGNEFLPYHPDASHIHPDHRDGWNACYKAMQAQQVPSPAMPLLAVPHTGMRVDYRGLLRQCRDGLRRDPANAEMLRQLEEHMTELGQRWYAGDIAVVDEVLQLYCVERDARKALVKLSPPSYAAVSVVEQDANLTVWYGKMPESCGRTNWTAILRGNGEDYTIDRSEYPDRVRYAADCVRNIIGDLPKKPFILDYDGDECAPCHICEGTGEKDGIPCWGLNFKGTVHASLRATVEREIKLQELTCLIRHHTEPQAFQEIRSALKAFTGNASQTVDEVETEVTPGPMGRENATQRKD